MRLCYNCQMELPDNAQYCRKCGKKQPAVEISPPDVQGNIMHSTVPPTVGLETNPVVPSSPPSSVTLLPAIEQNTAAAPPARPPERPDRITPPLKTWLADHRQEVATKLLAVLPFVDSSRRN